MRFRFVFDEVWTGLRRNLTMTLAVIITVTVSLALFGAGLLVRQQVAQVKGYWYDKVEVSIYLCTKNSVAPSCSGAATQAQKDQIRAELDSLQPLVQTVYFESAQEAYQHFQEQFAGTSLADTATPEDLGESFRVKLSDPEKYALVTSAFAGHPGVERVDDQRQLLQNLFDILDGMQWAALGIAILMLLTTVLLIVNTMQVAAHSRRRETGIMRLVGASSWYIQLPFIMEAAVAAALGALFAIGLLAAVRIFFIVPRLEPAIRSIQFIGWDAFWGTSLVIFVVGVVLAVIAAFVALSRYLRV